MVSANQGRKAVLEPLVNRLIFGGLMLSFAALVAGFIFYEAQSIGDIPGRSIFAAEIVGKEAWGSPTTYYLKCVLEG